VDGADLLSARQRHARDHRLEAQRDQQRDKQEQAAELGPKAPRLETKSTRVVRTPATPFLHRFS